jgi:hypothetical protein
LYVTLYSSCTQICVLLDDKKAALISISDDISILAYEKARGNYYYLDG